jgi:hypothetical protein
MIYSPIAKGILCKYCELFRPTLQRGSFSAFIVRGFKKFYQIHNEAKKHTTSRWHNESTAETKFFQDIHNPLLHRSREALNQMSNEPGTSLVSSFNHPNGAIGHGIGARL